MLDLVDGPIISEEAHAKMLEDPTTIETIDVANTKQEIQKLQLLYQRKQFGHEKHLIWRDGVKLALTEDEVLQTMRKLGTKNKAQSWDNVQDVIFASRAYKRVRFNGTSCSEFCASKRDEHAWVALIELKLAAKLTAYYNHLLSNDLPLPAK